MAGDLLTRDAIEFAQYLASCLLDQYPIEIATAAAFMVVESMITKGAAALPLEVWN